MSKTHGKNGVFAIDDSGGDPRDISAAINKVDFPIKVDSHDVTTFGTDDKEYISGLKGANFSIDGFFDTTVDGYLYGILGGDPGTFTWSPLGTGSGMPYFSGDCILTEYSINGPTSDVIKFTASVLVTGAVTRALYT